SGIQEMDRCIATEAEESGMAQREQARLAKQHVVREREDDHHPHLAQHGHNKSRWAVVRKIVEHPRQQDRYRQQHEPDNDRAPRHVSRVPSRPRGRKNRISTIIRSGSNAPMRATGTVKISPSRSSLRGIIPIGRNRSAIDASITTEKVTTIPMMIEAMKQPTN